MLVPRSTFFNWISGTDLGENSNVPRLRVYRQTLRNFFSPTSHRFLCKYAITRGNCHFEAIKFSSFCLPFVFPFSRDFWSIESKRFKRICTEIKKIVGRARQISISLLLHRNKCKITRGFECVIIEGGRGGGGRKFDVSSTTIKRKKCTMEMDT